VAAKRPIDNELLTALRAGEPSALALVYERFGDMVYGVALRFTGSTVDAEDVLQEVFLGLPDSMGQLRLPSAFGGWLRKIAIRTAIDHVRTVSRHEGVPSTIENDQHHPRVRGASIERVALEKAIAELPSAVRAVFLLREVEGYRHAEIAEMLGISVNASLQRLYRARGLLRDRLVDESK
jgi:RNA polymerase sigma-70 factor (ECF subfamily)